MRQGFFNRRIPTAFALILLVIGIGFAVLIGSNTTQFTGQAAPENEPRNIQISNIMDTSFTISYVTNSEVLGAIHYGLTEAERSDIQSGSTTPSRVHVFTLSNLKPSTAYSFVIISGGKEFTDKRDAFVVTTGPKLNTPPSKETTVSGTVVTADGSKGRDVLVYITADNGSIISTQTNNGGAFTINVSLLRTKDLTSYYPLAQDQKMTLSATSSNADTQAVFLLSQANPLPPLTLSQIYNFTIDEVGESATASGEIITFPLFRESATETQTVTILTPETDEGFTDAKPRFEGKALPNESVEIIIQSSHEIQTTVKADSKGTWTFRPDIPLEPGEHTLTVKTKDENGILRILTRSFIVYAEGSQFTEPSVSPSNPTVTSSPTKSPTPTLSLTPSPTAVEDVEVTPTPTEEPSLTPTPTPTTVITATITPVPTVEPTGSETAPLVLISSLGVLLTGTLMFVLSRMRSL